MQPKKWVKAIFRKKSGKNHIKMGNQKIATTTIFSEVVKMTAIQFYASKKCHFPIAFSYNFQKSSKIPHFFARFSGCVLQKYF